eukprot:Polyplicarium_translucidae@DN1698_c0_g1_i2.p1
MRLVAVFFALGHLRFLAVGHNLGLERILISSADHRQLAFSADPSTSAFSNNEEWLLAAVVSDALVWGHQEPHAQEDHNRELFTCFRDRHGSVPEEHMIPMRGSLSLSVPPLELVDLYRRRGIDQDDAMRS